MLLDAESILPAPLWIICLLCTTPDIKIMLGCEDHIVQENKYAWDTQFLLGDVSSIQIYMHNPFMQLLKALLKLMVNIHLFLLPLSLCSP